MSFFRFLGARGKLSHLHSCLFFGIKFVVKKNIPPLGDGGIITKIKSSFLCVLNFVNLAVGTCEFERRKQQERKYENVRRLFEHKKSRRKDFSLPRLIPICHVRAIFQHNTNLIAHNNDGFNLCL